MGHAYKGDKDQHQLDDTGLDRVHMDGGRGPLITEAPDELAEQVKSYAKTGKNKPKDLARLIDSLPDTYKAETQFLMPELAKRLSGDEVLEIGQILRQPLDARIDSALHAKTPVTDAALQRYLRTMSAHDIQYLGDNEKMLEKVRKLLPGKFGVELPMVADFPPELHSKPLLVKWYLEKTDKTVVAINFAARASDKLAASLDSLNEWSWLDHLHVAHSYTYGSGLETLRDKTTNQTAHDKLAKMLGTFKSSEYTAAITDAGKNDLTKELDANTSADVLLDAGGRAMGVSEQDPAKVTKRLENEKIDVVLEFVLATSMGLKQAAPLLAKAGANAEQMLAVVLSKTGEERIEALDNDKTRASIRKMLGKQLPLARLFPEPSAREQAHATLYKNDALREWAYDDKDALTKLWVAAGGSHAREACKLVRREEGFKWVHELSTTAPDAELRRFALNCGDDKAAKYVREHVLADRDAHVSADENEKQDVDTEVYGKGVDAAKARINVAALSSEVDATRVTDRIADMNAAERAAVLKDDRELEIICQALSGESLVRAVYLLAPTIAQLLKMPIRSEYGMLDYIASRPAAEQEVALGKPALVKPARAMMPAISPLQIYPTLDDPKVMAKALDSTPDLLNWMLEDTEPSLALACLARDGVRDAAEPLFESRAKMWQHLPAYKQLLPAGKRAFDAFAKMATEDESKEEIDQYKHGKADIDAAVEKRGQQMADASAEAHLWDAIDKLNKSHGNMKSALALVNNASAKERLALLDGSHTTSVENLKNLAPLSPRHIFQGLSTAQLLSTKDGAAWLLDGGGEPAFVTLSRVAGDPKGVAALGAALSADTKRAAVWIAQLPQGAQLTSQERHALDQLCSHIEDEDLIRALFLSRYGTTADDTFTGKEAKRVWGVLARLPPAQVNQKVIESFTHEEIGDSAAGLWDHHNVVMHERRSQTEGTDQSFNDTPNLSEDQIKKYYGLDDKKLAEATAGDNAWISKDQGKFKVNPINIDQFDSTVLHEVGHSVDQMLGEQTDLIYGQGGWKRYGVDQFEEWAKEMGALGSIDGKDKKEIVTVWKDAIRAGTPVNEMVDDTHPALAKKYEKDPLVQSARNGWTFQYKADPRPTFNGRVFTTNGVVLSSVPQQTADTAPSEYAMSAPAEYFAECYVEYYRGYKGTPKTEEQKGGHLASWIKTWFTQNVDNARFNPQRLHGNVEKNEQPDGTPKKSG